MRRSGGPDILDGRFNRLLARLSLRRAQILSPGPYPGNPSWILEAIRRVDDVASRGLRPEPVRGPTVRRIRKSSPTGIGRQGTAALSYLILGRHWGVMVRTTNMVGAKRFGARFGW